MFAIASFTLKSEKFDLKVWRNGCIESVSYWFYYYPLLSGLVMLYFKWLWWVHISWVNNVDKCQMNLMMKLILAKGISSSCSVLFVTTFLRLFTVFFIFDKMCFKACILIYWTCVNRASLFKIIFWSTYCLVCSLWWFKVIQRSASHTSFVSPH